MDQVDIDELRRVATIFDSWSKLRASQVAAAESFGFGITDSLARRESDELQSAVGGLFTLITKYENPQ